MLPAHQPRLSPVWLLAALGALPVLLAAATAPAALPVCDPAYDPAITSPAAAISGWPERPATAPEIAAYVTGLDAQSDRVVTGIYATSFAGTPLYYALVGDAAAVADADTIAATQQELRDPRRTGAARAADIAANSRAIAWYVANVHGIEPAGGDAALQLLYELAARTDCTAAAIRSALLVGVIPTQNPESRTAGTYDNAYGINPNADWFALTQPETDGALRLLRQYPPVLLVDAHEMSGSSFFFPPNADPIFHEVSPQALHWINDRHSPALQQTFADHHLTEPRQWTYFNYGPYDLFAAIYADSVTTLAFNAAGMTFEKGMVDRYEQRYREHFVAGFTTLLSAAEHKAELLQQYYDAHVEALAQGHAGTLAKNVVQQPGNELVTQVPDFPVKHYFVGRTRAAADADRLVTRLRAFGVEVYRLTAALPVADLGGYGDPPGAGVLPAGTYWIPMAQPQKRWVEAVLGDQTYPAVAFFYDVSAWSNPLLMNVDAWFSGAALSPVAEPVTDATRPPLAAAAAYELPGDTARAVGAALALVRAGVHVERLSSGRFAAAGAADVVDAIATRFGVSASPSNGTMPPGTLVRAPKIAVFDPFAPGNPSYDQLRFFLDHMLETPWTPLTADAVGAGRLAADRFDVFVVAGVSTALLDAARPPIQEWIESGGVFVGTARPGGTGGTPFAVASGWTSAALANPDALDIPGTLFRVFAQPNSPVTVGASSVAYWFHIGEPVLSRSTTGSNGVVFLSNPCAGDCSLDGEVTVDDLLAMVNVALGTTGLGTCGAGDANRDGSIAVDDILTAVQHALNACPAADLWLSGYAQGTAGLVGSAGLVDERLGAGHVVLFSGEPHFRMWTDGTQFLLANALAYPRADAARRGIDVRARAASAAVARAQASVGPSIGPGRPLRIRVPAAQADAALAVLHRFTPEVTSAASGDTVVLVIPNPTGLAADVHPFARRLLPALAAAGVEVRYAAL